MTGPARPFTGAPAGYPGQSGQPQPQQQATHPTIGDLGMMPGGLQPQATVRPQMQQPQPPQFQNQQLAQANPQQSLPQGLPQQPGQGLPQHPTIQLQPQPQQQIPPGFQPNNYQQTAPLPGYPSQQVPQQQVPQQPQFQTPQGQNFEIPDHAIMQGASVPPELRGRTWGQVRQIYGALASQFLAGRQQPQVQPQTQQPEPQAPAPQGGRPASPQGGGFWSDPEGTIARVVDQRINTAMAPMQQQTLQSAAEQAMRVAASGISDWNSLYPEIIQVVSESGADSRSLGSPTAWSNAADLARGRLAGRGQYNPGVVPAPTQQQRGPGAFVPAQVAPPVGGFFTEAPTPPQPTQYGGQINTQLTDQEDYYRQKSGLSVEEFVNWRAAITRVR